MSLTIRCPICGESDVVPDSALEKQACCNACGSGFFVQNVVVDASDYEQPPKTTPHKEVREEIPKKEKLLLLIGLGVPAVVLIVFATYWFALRDSWEQDNFMAISTQCHAVIDASNKSNDSAVMGEFQKLKEILGSRQLTDTILIKKFAEAEARADEVQNRREAAQAIAQKEEEDRLRKLAANDTTSFYNQYRDPPYMPNSVSGYQGRWDAIWDLSVQFNKSTDWVETHMGDTNSITVIHINLTRQRLIEMGVTD